MMLCPGSQEMSKCLISTSGDLTMGSRGVDPSSSCFL